MDKKLTLHLADVMELMVDPVCVVDRFGYFVFVSAAFETMFGYCPHEVIGKRMIDMVHPQDKQETLGVVETIIAEKVLPGIENRWIHKDGRVVNVLWSARWSEEHQVRIAVAHDITERKNMEALLMHAACHDDLTDLPNRSLLLDRLKSSITLADIKQTVFSVLFIDIDGFKGINDSHGHAVGDALLKKIAKRLCGCVRKSDTVGRLGGDEFLVILNESTDVDHVTMVAEKIRHHLAKDFSMNDITVNVASSIGVARYPDDGDQPLSLIHAADHAMYLAKHGGGNKVVLAQS
ncbi:GGDEF domain-containing protein [Marinomonas sp. A79]|uniref:GGDEF domain-containing protein n=1 Tax=Marinomonas vulgaris TaxID=2823372 RepID=A0ABS5HDT9_9GAMM|nr:sensor domain-containing diguanylate cyclase [Marinomonas vulgaris]MBR7889567.1 GGDEF domain-containing protein [Marinomonas vulgaris]